MTTVVNEKPREQTADPETAALAPRLDASHVSMGLMPKTVDEGIKLANLFAKSTLVPKDFQNNAANCFIALQWGSEIGLAPMQALQSIAVINGRPAVWGDAMLALVKSSRVFEWITEPPVEQGVATCTVKRKGEPAVVRVFTMDMAKTAGLLGKPGTWQSYPERMLQMRARGFALRDAFPDVLRGVITVEEARDIPPAVEPTGETFATVAITPPQRRSAAPPEPLPDPEPAPPETPLDEATPDPRAGSVLVVSVKPEKVKHHTIYTIELSDAQRSPLATTEEAVFRHLLQLRDDKTPIRNLVIVDDPTLHRKLLVEYEVAGVEP